MNYEFHVGDYVEAIGGLVGYVARLRPVSEGLYVFSVKYKDRNEYKEYNLYVHELSCFFKHIGAYDFTKKEKKKIEMISECNRGIFANTIKPENPLARMVSNEIIDKINELVDAVNELRDKENAT